MSITVSLIWISWFFKFFLTLEIEGLEDLIAKSIGVLEDLQPNNKKNTNTKRKFFYNSKLILHTSIYEGYGITLLDAIEKAERRIKRERKEKEKAQNLK